MPPNTVSKSKARKGKNLSQPKHKDYPKEVCHFATKNKIKTFNLGIVNNSGLVTLGKYDRFSIKECYSIYANALPKILSS